MRITTILITILLILSVITVYAQKENLYDCRFYKAYVTGDMSNWHYWIAELEEKFQKKNDNKIAYNVLKAYYGYVAYLIGVERDDLAGRYIEEAEKYISHLKPSQKYKDYAEAMHGAFIAFRIGINKAKAIYLGPKSMSHINKAIELNPNNPYALVEKGNAEFHMPRYFGGSYKQAADYFQKAIDNFEEQPVKIKCNWVYLNTLAWLAQSYERAGDRRKAEQTYQKIFSIEPEFKWVKEELYPEFKNREK